MPYADMIKRRAYHKQYMRTYMRKLEVQAKYRAYRAKPEVVAHFREHYNNPEAVHCSNLQPLWAIDNIRKGGK